MLYFVKLWLGVGVDGVLLRITQLIQLDCSFELQVWFDDKAGPVRLKVRSSCA